MPRGDAVTFVETDVIIAGKPMGYTNDCSDALLDDVLARLQSNVNQLEVTSWCWYGVGAALPLNTACPAQPF